MSQSYWAIFRSSAQARVQLDTEHGRRRRALAMIYYSRVISASFWVQLWLWRYAGPYLTEADFYPTPKSNFLKLISNLSIPAMCLVVDWGLRRAGGRRANGRSSPPRDI